MKGFGIHSGVFGSGNSKASKLFGLGVLVVSEVIDIGGASLSYNDCI